MQHVSLKALMFYFQSDSVALSYINLSLLCSPQVILECECVADLLPAGTPAESRKSHCDTSVTQHLSDIHGSFNRAEVKSSLRSHLLTQVQI